MTITSILHGTADGLPMIYSDLVDRFQMTKPYIDAVLSTVSQRNSDNTGATFMARVEGVTVATATAWVSPCHQGIGYIGLIQNHGQDEELASVLQACVDHLSNLGVDKIFAPVDRNIWFHYRTSLGNRPADRPLSSWETPYIQELGQILESLGFSAAQKFHSTGFESKEFLRAISILRPSYDESQRNGLQIVSPHTLPREQFMAEVFAMTCAAYKTVDLYEPITAQQFQNLYQSSGRLNDLSLTKILVTADQRIMGYLYAFPHNNFAVIKTLAVKDEAKTYFKKFRTTASSALLYAVLDDARQRDMRGGIAAMVRDDASSRFLEKAQMWASSWIDRYALWQYTSHPQKEF